MAEHEPQQPQPQRRRARQAMDLREYQERAQSGSCFICAFLAGDPAFGHEVLLEDAAHVAFLDRWPTLPGKLLVAPKRHVEHAVRDLTEAEYVSLMKFVRVVALAVEKALPVERTYLYTLGSRQGNAHLHWHVAGLPPGTPYAEQQFHALMTENGVLASPPYDAAAVAQRIRHALSGGR
jgi:histidine triad (HIT) family protein/ATP adenylyltransferase